MGVDAVLRFQVVLADGSVVNADANENSDLYWALRGAGGGTYGVVVAVTVRITPVPPLVSLMRFEWKDGAKALAVWEEFLIAQFNNKLLVPQAYTNFNGGARANVFYFGPIEELRKLVGPLQAIGPTASYSEKRFGERRMVFVCLFCSHSKCFLCLCSVPYIQIVHQFGGCKDPASVPANDPTSCMNFASIMPKAQPTILQEKQSPWVAMSAYVSRKIGAQGWASLIAKIKTLTGVMIIIDPHGIN